MSVSLTGFHNQSVCHHFLESLVLSQAERIPYVGLQCALVPIHGLRRGDVWDVSNDTLEVCVELRYILSLSPPVEFVASGLLLVERREPPLKVFR